MFDMPRTRNALRVRDMPFIAAGQDWRGHTPVLARIFPPFPLFVSYLIGTELSTQHRLVQRRIHPQLDLDLDLDLYSLGTMPCILASIFIALGLCLES